MNKIRAYRLKSHSNLFSFDDPMEEVPILGKSLSWWQEKAIKEAGLELVDIEDTSGIHDDSYFLFDNNLFFTPEYAVKVVELSEYHKRSLRFCLANNRFNERFSLPTGQESELLRPSNFYYIKKSDGTPKDVIVAQYCYKGALKLPKPLMKTGEYSYDQCDIYITAMLSPFHLWMANICMNLYRTIKYRRLIPDWIYDRFFQERSRNYFRALRFQNKIGKNCKIHPTAILEGVEIGDDVIIGANAVVRLSHIGDRVLIEDNTSVLYSVLGADTCISHNNLILASVTYEDVYLIHGPYQFSIYGKHSAIFGTINCDFRIDQNTITIQTENGIMDSRQPLVGIAFGHRSKVAGGNVIAPGRTVPNDYHVSSPELMISKFPPEKNANRFKDTIDWY